MFAPPSSPRWPFFTRREIDVARDDAPGVLLNNPFLHPAALEGPPLSGHTDTYSPRLLRRRSFIDETFRLRAPRRSTRRPRSARGAASAVVFCWRASLQSGRRTRRAFCDVAAASPARCSPFTRQDEMFLRAYLTDSPLPLARSRLYFHARKKGENCPRRGRRAGFGVGSRGSRSDGGDSRRMPLRAGRVKRNRLLERPGAVVVLHAWAKKPRGRLRLGVAAHRRRRGGALHLEVGWVWPGAGRPSGLCLFTARGKPRAGARPKLLALSALTALLFMHAPQKPRRPPRGPVFSYASRPPCCEARCRRTARKHLYMASAGFAALTAARGSLAFGRVGAGVAAGFGFFGALGASALERSPWPGNSETLFGAPSRSGRVARCRLSRRARRVVRRRRQSTKP